MTSTSPDAELLARLRAGEEAAFEELVRANTARLLGVCRRLVRCEEDARDAVQEAFMSAFQGLPRFEGQSKLSTWLHRIAVNACLMKLRTRRRRPEVAIESLLPAYRPDGRRCDAGIAWDQDLVSALDGAAAGRILRACIDRLPESYRTVLILRDVEELDTRETAEALGIRVETVKIRLHRARQALRTLLEPHVTRLVA
jgi:RNA polymerase sigma-70 factor (ECF subfamily)